MKRMPSNPNERIRDPRIIDETCNVCGHHKMFMSRGDSDPQYTKKCSKCGAKK